MGVGEAPERCLTNDGREKWIVSETQGGASSPLFPSSFAHQSFTLKREGKGLCGDMVTENYVPEILGLSFPGDSIIHAPRRPHWARDRSWRFQSIRSECKERGWLNREWTTWVSVACHAARSNPWHSLRSVTHSFLTIHSLRLAKRWAEWMRGKDTPK